MPEAHDTRAGFRGAFRKNFVAPCANAVLDAFRQVLYRSCDSVNSGFKQKLDRRSLPEAPDSVQSAALIPACIGPRSHVARRIIGVTGGICPTEFDGLDLIESILADIQYAVSLGTQHPFMPIGRECVDMGPLNINRERSHALNGIDKKETIAFTAEPTKSVEVHSVAAQIIDIADRQQPGAANRLGNPIKWIIKREPGDPKASVL